MWSKTYNFDEPFWLQQTGTAMGTDLDWPVAVPPRTIPISRKSLSAAHGVATKYHSAFGDNALLFARIKEAIKPKGADKT